MAALSSSCIERRRPEAMRRRRRCARGARHRMCRRRVRRMQTFSSCCAPLACADVRESEFPQVHSRDGLYVCRRERVGTRQGDRRWGVVLDMDVRVCFCMCAQSASEPSSTCSARRKGQKQARDICFSLSSQRVHGASTLHQGCEGIRGMDERS